MNKVDENTLMAYLYGELGPEEKEAIEKQLKEDAALADKLNELKKVRDMLGKLEDQVPEVPLIIEQKRNIMPARLYPWLGAAAAILLLLLVGFLTETSISISDRQLAIYFGKTSQPQTERLTNEEDLLPILETALKEQEEVLMNRLQVMQARLESQIEEVEPGNSAALSEQTLQAYLARYRQQQMLEMSGLLENNLESQREELRTFLAEYHQFLEERRIQDLQLIEAGFQAMQENVNQQKQETEEILANIITTANNTNYQ